MNGDIAIVGIGCRLPGGANSPDSFWRLLRDGIDAITEMPADGFDLDRLFDPDASQPGKMYTRWAGSWMRSMASIPRSSACRRARSSASIRSIDSCSK